MGKGAGAVAQDDRNKVTDQKHAAFAARAEDALPYSITEKVMFVAGMFMVVFVFPVSVVLVGTTVLWDGLDRLFMGRPLDGVTYSFARWWNKVTAPYFEPFVRHPADAFVVNVALLQGVIVPFLFGCCFYSTLTDGFSWKLAFAYHVFRLGPYFMNFAYCYVQCHKEAHSHLGIFKKPYHYAFQLVFNWWCGMFYGVIPSTFSVGHTINHHKYNNGPKDVVSTSDKPRDSVVNFIAYLPRFLLYGMNISTFFQFIDDKEYSTAIGMLFGSFYYVLFVGAFWMQSPQFAVVYTLFPLIENVMLLACISWAWHAHLNPEDPEDEFVGSITILGGPIQVQGEDYHVVHHKYPGSHWSENERLYEQDKALGEYGRAQPGSVFNNTHAFEVFALIILRKYDELADRFTDMSVEGSTWTHADKVNVIKSRLRTVWWGRRADKSIKLEGKEIRKQ
ncbi:hypothetical protein DIPPA_15170 [Diplonema papillatum]|nr:hypothetical protein DIPPA_15170 [Diplonema papillatum]